MKQQRRFASLGHPLAMNSFRLWLSLLRQSRGIDSRYLLRALNITLISFLLIPFRRIEYLLYNKKIRAVHIQQPPVFIIGHCRSGTTHLHNLMSQDPNLGFIQLYHIVIPAANFITKRFLKPIIAHHTPDKRPMDNMPLSMQLPQEEEWAMCNLSPYSPYIGWYFPKRMKEVFHRFLLFDDISQDTILKWRKAYMNIIKKATLMAGGKRLVLKNPANTGRLKAILELFPDAKFVHIYRSPYLVYQSCRRLYPKLLQTVALQDISEEEIKENILYFFVAMMKRYLRDKALIPKENLIEVRFENIEDNPMEELARIYSALEIDGWDEAKPYIEAYIDTLADYQKNEYQNSEEDLLTVEKYWKFALDQWHYQRPNIDKKTSP